MTSTPQPHDITRSEVLLPGPALALAGLLGIDPPEREPDGLPLLWHWLYLLERPAQVDLGPDGHPIRGVIPAPPQSGQRRMWAGGRVRSLGALVVGQEATRRTRVISQEQKQGRSGRLTFVVVQHEISQAGRVCVLEEQDIVYRDAATIAAPAEPVMAAKMPLAPGDWSIDIDPTLLFRFSALTYNAHRIHYDREYARQGEGYAGLVTHGPLQALAMAECARAQGASGRLKIDYRLVSPLIDHEGLVAWSTATDEGWQVGVRNVADRQTATGTISRLPEREPAFAKE